MRDSAHRNIEEQFEVVVCNTALVEECHRLHCSLGDMLPQLRDI
jgi:hypothetical protein